MVDVNQKEEKQQNASIIVFIKNATVLGFICIHFHY